LQKGSGTVKEIGIGLIGAGYMGKAHSVAMAAVGPVFKIPFATSVQNDPNLRSSIETSIHFINRHLPAE